MTVENRFDTKKIKDYELEFDDNGIAMVYAPNGIMNISLVKILEVIQKRERPADKIFSEYPYLMIYLYVFS